MTAPLLTKLRELDAAATKGPWSPARYSNFSGWSIYGSGMSGCIAERWYPGEVSDSQNAEMIATSSLLVFMRNHLSILLRVAKCADARVAHKDTMPERQASGSDWMEWEDKRDELVKAEDAAVREMREVGL